MTKFQSNPAGYARDVLGVAWWSKQQEIAEALLRPPYRVLVKASHNVGKTFLAGSLVNWWYDIYDPGLTLTTAPTDTQVRDLLWKEVRVQRGNRGGFRGPQMPRLESSKNHWAHGYTAKDSDGFQGRHEEHMLFVFDEAVGVDGQFWEAAESMFGGEGHAWLCIFNPTDTSSQAYKEELSGRWTVLSISMLEHPNILAEAQGEPPPYPAAIRSERVDDLIRHWCTPVASGDQLATDIEWPLGSGQYWRPGPEAEARMLGRWPSQATYNVWGDGVWAACESKRLQPSVDDEIEIGCDVARFGDDFTEIHIRRGPCSLHHEAHNGWKVTQTAGRLKELARQFGFEIGQDPLDITIRIDDAGVGGGVVDLADEGGPEFNFIPVNAGRAALAPEKYPNRRSELWFAVAERAMEVRLDLTRLPADVRTTLRSQAMAPTWSLDSQGRRVVEPKDRTKKRIGRSPDGMDALNLAYSGGQGAFL